MPKTPFLGEKIIPHLRERRETPWYLKGELVGDVLKIGVVAR